MGWRDGKPAQQATGWRSGRPVEEEEGPGQAKAFLGGNLQGVTAGFFDDIAGFVGQGAVGGGVKLGKGAQPAPDDSPQLRAMKEQALADQEASPSNREILSSLVQGELDEAQAAWPKTYGTGRVTGTLLTAPVVAKALPSAMGLGGSMLAGAGLGGLNAAGESRASPVRGQIADYLKDIGKGAALGAGAGGLGYGLTGAMSGAPRLLATMGSGGVTGGVMGALGSEEETLGGKLQDALFPAFLGAAGSGAGYGATKLGAGAARATVKGAVKPTPEAQFLREQGVNNLTIGQMNPKSALGQIEEVGTSAALVGPKLQAQREAARTTFGKAAVSRAVPKGGSSLVKGDMNEQLADAYRQQGERYDEVRASPLSGRAQARPVNVKNVGKAFEAASKSPDVLATEADTAAVGRFLANQKTLLDRQGATPETLMRVRQNIRDQASGLEAGSAQRQLLERSEQTITNRLQYALPARSLETLRDTDKGYGAYKTMESAVGAAKDGPLTPNNITMAIKANTDRGAYARGAGGELRQMAQAGHEVFDQKTPPTGARLLASGRYNPLPWAARLANSPSVKPFALGETQGQQKVAAIIEALANRAPKMSPVGGRMPEAFAPTGAAPSYAQGAYADIIRRLMENEETAGR
jgi:hypothetical protein